MRYRLKLSPLILIGFMTAGMQLSLAAEDNVGLGLYLKPEYPSAEDYETVVLPSFDFTVGEIGIPLNLLGVDDPALLIGSVNLRSARH